jgi:ATP-dependent DNA ligase
MELPVLPPIEPMLAKSVPEIPTGEGMTYEPKWDGFRCIVFRDGDEVELASRGGKTMTRYFPEVIEQVRAQFPPRCVVDGELVVIRHDPDSIPKLDFELLAQRIHPAASRVKLLAETTPASFIAFDLLAVGDESLMDVGYASRRARLEDVLAGVKPPVHVTAITSDVTAAREWFDVLEGAGLDGLVAKPADIPYEPGKRLMYKVKHARTADTVVAGFRWHKDGPIVGSLLLGLYDDEGVLHHVGVSASFTAAEHPWAAWASPEAHTEGGQRMPGAPSRWSGKKDLGWEPLRPELVVEVGYDAMEGDRLRHTAQFKRWRPDREPRSCTYEQLERPVRVDVTEVLAGRV